VLPVEAAEEAAQLNLDAAFRKQNRNGQPMMPGKVFIELESRPRARPKTIERWAKERAILASYRDEKGWSRLGANADVRGIIPACSGLLRALDLNAESQSTSIGPN
jgi:hypothetical protein